MPEEKRFSFMNFLLKARKSKVKSDDSNESEGEAAVAEPVKKSLKREYLTRKPIRREKDKEHAFQVYDDGQESFSDDEDEDEGSGSDDVGERDEQVLKAMPHDDDEDPEVAEVMYKQLLWRMNAFGRWQKAYADYEWSLWRFRIPDHDFFIRLSFALLPPLFIFTLWDFLAATVFAVPHLTFFQNYGVLMPIHWLCIQMIVFGFIMRQMYKEPSVLTKMAFIGTILHFIVFIFHCYNDVAFDAYRDDYQARYEMYISAANGKPDDYSADIDYDLLRYQSRFTKQYF